MFVTEITTFPYQLHCNQVFNYTTLSLLSFANSYCFSLMRLQIRFIFREVHGKDSDIHSRIQISDKLSDGKTKVGKKLQNSNRETYDFKKLLTRLR